MSKVFQGGVLYINGLPVVHAGPGGHASAPEECWVTVAGQKVKKPFVNTAFSQDLEGTAEGVFVNGYPIATMASCTTTSYGDESSEGGVKSGTKQGKLTFLSGSPNVFIGGVPAVRHGDAVILNDGNSEVSTWVQPAKHAPATARLTSDPIDSTVQDHALNIELVRDPKLQFTPPHVAQCFSVVHEQTSHTTFHSFGVFKETNNQFLWHDDIFPAGVYSVTETFPKQGDKAMHIPLGKIKAVSPDNHAPGMKLMPMSFRRQDSSTSSHAGIKPLYPHTYLYIFKDGYLWREITVNHLGRLLEVDLSTSIPGKGRNVTGELTQGIMLPLEDADGKHTFSIAVSVIQWTWAMIHLMGGLNPNDPRFEPYHYLPIEKDQKLISLRLQHINLDALPIDNQLIWHDETIDPPPKDVHPMSPEAKKVHTVPGAAVFVLNDPIGRLIETAEKLLGERYEYLAFAEDNKDKYIVGMLAGTIIDAAAKMAKTTQSMSVKASACSASKNLSLKTLHMKFLSGNKRTSSYIGLDNPYPVGNGKILN